MCKTTVLLLLVSSCGPINSCAASTFPFAMKPLQCFPRGEEGLLCGGRVVSIIHFPHRQVGACMGVRGGVVTPETLRQHEHIASKCGHFLAHSGFGTHSKPRVSPAESCSCSAASTLSFLKKRKMKANKSRNIDAVPLSVLFLSNCAFTTYTYERVTVLQSSPPHPPPPSWHKRS